MHVELAIKRVQAGSVKENQDDKDVDRPLLGEPEAEAHTTDTDGVECIGKNDPEAVRDDEPDHEQTYQQA